MQTLHKFTYPVFLQESHAHLLTFLSVNSPFHGGRKQKMEANVPRKKSRLAKNKKKAWRKVDITDVEEFLEDERLQERTG